MKKIKVLIVAGDMNVGGIENQLMHLLRNADKNKFQIDFTTTCEKPFFEDEIVSLGSACIRLPETEGIHFLRYCKALYKVIRDGNYDIVHSHELFHSGMVLLTAKIAGVKCRFVHAHNWSDGTGKQSIIRKCYNAVMRFLIQQCATDYIACSSFAGDYLYGEKITKQNNFHLVFNSVDTEKFLVHYDDIEEGEWCDDWENVIQVGRFTEVKNQLFTADIANELRKRGLKIRFLCVGNNGGDYEHAVQEKIKKLDLNDYMQLLGIRRDIDVLMRKSKAFILPSEYEGMPLVMIEAQASGLPCVIADTFSHEVDFGLGYVQWLKLSDSVSEWVDAVERAVDTKRAEKKNVAEVIEKKKFDSKMFAKILCELYAKSYIKEM